MGKTARVTKIFSKKFRAQKTGTGNPAFSNEILTHAIGGAS
jgi:hypothetical protein